MGFDSGNNQLDLLLDEAITRELKKDDVETDEENISSSNFNIEVKSIRFEDVDAGFYIFEGEILKRKSIEVISQGYKQQLRRFVCRIEDQPEFVLKLGQKINCIATWEEHKQYGLQAVIKEVSEILIETDEDITTFLLNQGLSLVNHALAQDIIRFAKTHQITLNSLLSDPKALRQVPHEENDLMVEIAASWFLYRQSFYFAKMTKEYGLGIASGRKVFNAMIHFSPATKRKVEEVDILHNLCEDIGLYQKATREDLYQIIFNLFIQNPYDYVTKGVGFKSLDKFSLNYGFGLQDPRRLEALLAYELEETCNKNKNTIVDVGTIQALMNGHGVPYDISRQVLSEAAKKKKITARRIDDKVMLSPTNLFIAEFQSAKAVKIALTTPLPKNHFPQELFEQFTKNHNDATQIEAVKNTLNNRISIITGGPGVGKTTTLKILLRIYANAFPINQVVLLAPTGLAAKRINQTLKSDNILKTCENVQNAITIHKFVYPYIKKTKEVLPLRHALIVVDESSMIESVLFSQLTRCIDMETCQLVLVGDIDQLPPVEVGQVMRDLIMSNKLVVSRLTTNHRVSSGSTIPLHAKDINCGRQPAIMANHYKTHDFAFVRVENEQKAFDAIEQIILDLVELGYARKDIQILSPKRKGVLGVYKLNAHYKWLLNEELPVEQFRQNLLRKNPHAEIDRHFILGDKVINTKNNYELDIFNGEMGIVVHNEEAQPDELSILRDIGEKPIAINKAHQRHVELAYAITTHKSQGSEAPVIIMPLTNDMMFNRFLLYTGVTRAKEKVILIGQPEQLRKAIFRTNDGNRKTSLIYEMEHVEKHQQVYDEIQKNMTILEELLD